MKWLNYFNVWNVKESKKANATIDDFGGWSFVFKIVKFQYIPSYQIGQKTIFAQSLDYLFINIISRRFAMFMRRAMIKKFKIFA